MIEYHLINETIEYASEICMDQDERVFIIPRSTDETVMIPVGSVVKIVHHESKEQ